jgi:hypothetical protein
VCLPSSLRTIGQLSRVYTSHRTTQIQVTPLAPLCASLEHQEDPYRPTTIPSGTGRGSRRVLCEGVHLHKFLYVLGRDQNKYAGASGEAVAGAAAGADGGLAPLTEAERKIRAEDDERD